METGLYLATSFFSVFKLNIKHFAFFFLCVLRLVKLFHKNRLKEA